mmetsp:Transcript_28210/g.40169  ORF Transcript_28210/g.40169 Transcript_28210/m.40169 type:complete len:928 (+) Transcript_28210:19-2802(+)
MIQFIILVTYAFNLCHSFVFIGPKQLSFRATSSLSLSHLRLNRRISGMPSLRADIGNQFQEITEGVPYSKFFCALALDPDLNVAVKQIIDKASAEEGLIKSAQVVMFFVSSLYEATAFSYDIIFEALKQYLPGATHIIGCTTGCPVGPIEPYGEPSEIEARASLSVVLASLGSEVSPAMFSMSTESIRKYCKSPDDNIISYDRETSSDNEVVFMLATEDTRPQLSDLMCGLEKRGRSSGGVVGAVASSVTTLHKPKLFIAQWSGNEWAKYDKLTSGVVGLALKGNIALQTVLARSCVPVGPMFEVKEANKREIMSLKMAPFHSDDPVASSVTSSPLEQLDAVLKALPTDQSYSLKRELLVGMVPESPSVLSKAGASSIFDSAQFYSQKPIAFDPMTGSITVSCLPEPLQTNSESESPQAESGQTFQFCVRDTPTARQDLQEASESLRSMLQNIKDDQSTANDDHPLAVLMFGSMERGNKVFRYQSWESRQMYQSIKDTGFAASLPLAGLFSSGAFTNRLSTASSKEGATTAAVLEADTLYVLLSEQSSKPVPSAGSVVREEKQAVLKISDILTAVEKRMFDDSEDGVIVTKRDPESAHPVRVASMDYFIPEKIPQPSNFLESLVWDREKEVDKMRERFQLARALALAKAAAGKFPSRDLNKILRDIKLRNKLLSAGGVETPPLMIEVLRASVNNGKLTRYLDTSTNDGYAAYSQFPGDCAAAVEASDFAVNIAAIGCNVDSGTFRGQYEDLEVIKKRTKTLPVFCNDFVVYAYQLFNAKSSGADAVKLMCSVLSVQEVSYLVKIGRAIGDLMCVAVVSSKSQLLELLAPGAVPGLQAVSISSRNMRLWKVDPRKAERILSDPQVQQAIAEKRKENPDFLVFQEAFADKEELAVAQKNGVDAVFLGEELLVGGEDGRGIVKAIQEWLL